MQYIPKWLHQLVGSQDVFDALMDIQGESYRKTPERHTQKIMLAGHHYFIKQYVARGFWGALADMFRRAWPANASVEWHAIQAVQSLGIATTPPVAYAVCGKNPITQRSFLLTQALENTMNLEDLANTQAFRKNPLLKRDLLKQVAYITKTLHQHGMNHRDLYLWHFLLTLDENGKIPARYESALYLIDLHRLQLHKNIPQRLCIKDLAALYFSSFDAGLTQRDYLRFLKIYTGLPLREALQQKRWQTVFAQATKIYHRRNADKPFSIAWPIHKILTTTPQKRWVIRSTWQQKPVVIKIFSSKRTAKRSIDKFNELCARGVLAPTLLKITQDKTGDYTCLIFEELSHTPLKEQLQEAPVEIAKKLIPIVANHHKLGVVQGDMHLNNFIIMDDLIYTIDTDQMSFYKHPVSESVSLKSLAQFIVQFPPEVKSTIPALYQIYCEQRGWEVSPHALKKLRQEMKDFAKYRKKKFLESLFREGSALKAEQNFFSRALWSFEVDTPEFRQFVQDPDAVFKTTNAKMLTQKKRRTMVKIEINGEHYVVKRYNMKNRYGFYSLSRLIRPTRAARVWRMAHLFQFSHIPATPPIALIEKRWGPLRRESYLVTKFLEGKMLLDVPKVEQAQLQTQVLKQIANMHGEQLTHGDLKLKNILISNGRPFMLDLDTAKIHDWPFMKNRRAAKDNALFLKQTLQKSVE